MTYGEEWYIEDSQVQEHAQRDCSDQIGVLPYWQPEQALVFRQRVHGIKHLDSDQDGETHGGRTVRHHVRKHLATDLREEVRALVEVRLHEDELSV